MGSHTRLAASPAVRKRYSGALKASPRLDETYLESAMIICLDQEHTFGQVKSWRPFSCTVHSVAFAQTRLGPA